MKKRKIIGFKTSKTEINHLLKAWLAISFAFAILLSNNNFNLGFIITFFISALTVGLGFVVHEMAHKLVAQKYGCFAEFRANFTMLLLAIAMSFFGFLIAAPGAVVIGGNPGLPRSGRISAAGPGSNFVLALLFLPLLFLQNPFFNGIGNYGFMINSFLGLFNLIPFGMFDGAKILRWNKTIYGTMVGVGFLLLIVQPYLTSF